MPFIPDDPNQKGHFVPDKMGGKPPMGAFLKKAASDLIPQVQAGKYLSKNLQTALPPLGMLALSPLGPLGMAAGAGLGQIGSRMVDIAKGSPVQSPMKEAIGPMTQTALAGILEVSGIMKPGTSTLAQKFGQGLDRAGQTLTGVKKGVLPIAFKEGFNIYKAPSLPKAQELFGMALGPEGREAMQQGAKETFRGSVGGARKIATDIGTKIENGETVSGIDALKARQATDRIISATPETDKVKRDALYKWRTKFDGVMTSQSGPLKGASNLYRRAIVKDQLLEPTRITKSGRPSAFLPMIMGAGGRGAEGILNTLVGTSPAAWGAGAATLGSINPTVAKSILSALIQKATQEKGNQ